MWTRGCAVTLNILLLFLFGMEILLATVKGSDCGQPSLPAVSKYRRGRRIVGGNPVHAGKWPWVAALLFNNSIYCAGSILRQKWIVTASHCFHDNFSSFDPRDWLLIAGKFNLKRKEWHEQSSKVKRIFRHPNYTSLWDEHQIDVPDDNDVAILELETPLNYSNYVKPICLQQRDQASFPAGQVCRIAGWGHTKFNGHIQDVLNDVQVELVSLNKCNSPESYNGSVHQRAICAGYETGGRDACQYDSGGPLFCETGGRWYLVGQVSWGEECALPHKYGVYSNMKILAPWVEQIMETN